MSAEKLALYVHWPFCKAKCPYCDFNSHVREHIDHRRWKMGLLREMAHFAAQTEGRTLSSIFFGGGTPSLMAPETTAAVIAAAKDFWTAEPDLEVTLEANPTSSEADKFRAFREAGVNRLSVGVQSLDKEALAFLGREHSAGEALAAVGIAREAFERFSFDLIYARPGQSPEDWAQELEAALAEGPEHISLYQLTIEENTPFHARHRRGELPMPPDEETAALYEMTQAVLETAGLPAYEISNHAKAGAESRHNLTYWRYQDYVGIGPGAHGRLTLGADKIATRQHRAPEAWLESVEKQGHASRDNRKLSQDEQIEEMVLMGLRLREGISEVELEKLCGQPAEALFGKRLTVLKDQGLLEQAKGRLTATAEGRQRLNALLGYLMADL